MKTLDAWIAEYNRKSGEQFQLLPNVQMWANREHGFCCWEQKGETLWIRACSCDAKYWVPIMVDLAKGFGCTRLATTTKRNPQAMCRVFGATVTGTDNGNYVLIREV